MIGAATDSAFRSTTWTFTITSVPLEKHKNPIGGYFLKGISHEQCILNVFLIDGKENIFLIIKMVDVYVIHVKTFTIYHITNIYKEIKNEANKKVLIDLFKKWQKSKCDF